MQLNAPSMPSAAARSDAGSMTSPRASSTPSGRSSRALAGSRTSATTLSPRSASRRATALPIFPVAPVTRALIGRPPYPGAPDDAAARPSGSAVSTPQFLAALRPAPVAAGHRGVEGPPGLAPQARGDR